MQVLTGFELFSLARSSPSRSLRSTRLGLGSQDLQLAQAMAFSQSHSALCLLLPPARLLALSNEPILTSELTTSPPHSQSPPLSPRVKWHPAPLTDAPGGGRGGRGGGRGGFGGGGRGQSSSPLPSPFFRSLAPSRESHVLGDAKTDNLEIYLTRTPRYLDAGRLCDRTSNRRWWTWRRLLGRSWRCWWRTRWWFRWWTRRSTPWRWTWWRA